MHSSRHGIIQQDVETIAAAHLPWDRFFGKTILITGANGFVPAYMLETLLYLNEIADAKIRILALVRNKEKAMRKFAHHIHRPELELIVQDIRDPYTGPAPVNFVIHAAGQASPKYFGIDPIGTFETNVIGTQHMLKLARESNAEGFLFFSSGEIYGRVEEQNIAVKETDCGYVDPMQVRSCYAEGKRAGETLCASWHAQYGVPAKIVRLSHTYGPGMETDDGRVFADFVADIVAHRNIVMKSNGAARRPFCYLADATIAFFTVLLLGNNGEAYNVGSDVETSIIGLAEMLCSIFPERGCRVVHQERRPDDPYLVSKASGGHLDLSKVKSLGWQPTTGIHDGFRRTVQSYE